MISLSLLSFLKRACNVLVVSRAPTAVAGIGCRPLARSEQRGRVVRGEPGARGAVCCYVAGAVSGRAVTSCGTPRMWVALQAKHAMSLPVDPQDAVHSGRNLGVVARRSVVPF